MNRIKNHRGSLLALSLVVLVIACLLVVAIQADEKKEPCFYSSLHHTGEGMRYWYEENGGFMDIAGIPYKELDCGNCHVKSCDPCHAGMDGEVCTYSLKKAKDKATCLTCHSREKVTFAINEKKGNLDIHVASGMVCSDCHEAIDVHGDGTAYKTMRDEGAVKAKCTNCHEFDEENLSRPHKVHKGKLDCAACHVANTTTCLNCHFTKFLETGTRAGNFIPPSQDWMLLVNYNGKVTSGNVQTLIHEGKPFIAYAPYYTHAVQKEARGCTDCHANDAINLITEGKSVPMATFKGGKVESWSGVVPLVPDQLEWVFLDRDGETWVPITFTGKVKIQLACYATPLTEDQVKKMAMPFKK
jgi:hypothetical protein